MLITPILEPRHPSRRPRTRERSHRPGLRLRRGSGSPCPASVIRCLGLGGVGLQLAAQLGQVDPQVVGLRRRSPGPRPRAAARAARRACRGGATSSSRMPHSVGRQVHLGAVGATHPLRGEVDAEVAGVDDGLAVGRRGGGPAHRGPQPGEQLVHAERLGDVVVGAARRGPAPCPAESVRADSTMIGTLVQPRSPAITSVPSRSGRPRSSTTTSGGSSAAARSAAAAVGGVRTW